MLFLIFVMQFGKLIDNLRFLQPTMSDGRKHRIPVMKAVLADNNILIFRFVDLRQLNAFRLAKSTEKFSSSGDILRFQFMPEPLIDLVEVDFAKLSQSLEGPLELWLVIISI